MQLVNLLRRGLVRYPPLRAMEQLLSRLKTTQNNPELLLQLQKQAI
jgi:transcription termination factor Rho